ncbi:hypothetical protein Ddc_10216 [Ditylenchus destructor]|nr:hypothetical protein Ddc_10216 [Ditylenchus destructor]
MFVALLRPPGYGLSGETQENKETTVYESIGSTYQSIGSTGSHYSEISPPLKNLELLLEKLKIQFYFCFFGIVFTILFYLAMMSRCCELPFQKSSCIAGNTLPPLLTNHSTLAEEVNEFITSARAITFNLHDAIEIPSLADRQKTFQLTDYDLWELIQQHSANLAAFGAIKREDERREELEEAVSDGYSILYFLAAASIPLNIVMAAALIAKTRKSELSHLDRSKDLSAEESDNFQNARQKKVKRQIPIFYMATLICFMVQMGLYAAFLESQYYTGHCLVYEGIEIKRKQASRRGETYLPKSFSDYPSFADKLQSTLDLHLEELNKTMQSPILEVRELGWNYEYNAIEAAFRHHLELKQYHVDRNVMPRKISYAPQDADLNLLIFCLVFNVLGIGFWAIQEGSMWQPWEFLQLSLLKSSVFAKNVTFAMWEDPEEAPRTTARRKRFPPGAPHQYHFM